MWFFFKFALYARPLQLLMYSIELKTCKALYITVPERQRNTHLLQRNTNKKITEHSLFSSIYSYISSSINCFLNSWCISRGMWIKNIFIHLYHQSKSIYGDQGLRNNSLKLRYDFSCFCAKKRNTRQNITEHSPIRSHAMAEHYQLFDVFFTRHTSNLSLI